MSSPILCICGTKPDPELPSVHPEKCPECGEPPEMNYGFAGGGLGVYAFCCGRVLSKAQDLDEAIDRALDEREPRVPGCLCHLEVGDSPCPVHGEESP